MSIEPRAIPHMRAASYLLPDPGGSVVRDLLDEVERLQSQLKTRLAPDPRVAVLEAAIIEHESETKGRVHPLGQYAINRKLWAVIAARRGEVEG